MDTYTGTKTVKATPMTLGDYNVLREWKMPENEDPNAPGYLVEYQDGGKANHTMFGGYISWSPADVFERSYRPHEDGRAKIAAINEAAAPLIAWLQANANPHAKIILDGGGWDLLDGVAGDHTTK